METFSARRYYRTLLFVYTLIIVLLGAGLAGAGFFVLLPASLGEGYGAVLSTIQRVEQMLAVKVTGIYAVMSIFIIVAMVVLHLFYSHRIAGPAYRFGREASGIGQGNLRGNIRFRKKDNLTDMADSLNQVASRYRTCISAINDYLSLMEAQSKSITRLIEQGGRAPTFERTAHEITVNLKNVGQVLSEIRT